MCPLVEKHGTFIARCNALIEKVSSFIVVPWPPPFAPQNGTHTTAGAGAVTVVQGRAVQGTVAGEQPSLRFSPLAGRMDAIGGASLVLRHVEMSGMVAIPQPTCYGGFACGGAVLISGGGNLTVEHALFQGNRAGQGADGGAIKVIAGSSVRVRYATFTRNQANFGGALNLQGCGLVELLFCVLERNEAVAGGGLRVNLGGPGAALRSTLRITESEFDRNIATKEGGAFDLFMHGKRGRGMEYLASCVDCRGLGNTEPAIYQSRDLGSFSLSEADVLLGGAHSMSRWGLISFRTAARQIVAGVAQDGACQLPLQSPLGTRTGAPPGTRGCAHGAGAIPNGSSCKPAICAAATPDLGVPSTLASCKDGVLIWKDGCACNGTQHDTSHNESLPDWGVCAPNL
eukprot:SAG31_NODE_1921_length_6916_cov_6.643245_7_plen_400_part_00